MAQKLANWFVSENGRRIMSYAACTTGVGIITAYSLPNTILLDQYEEVVHLYK